MGLSSTKDGSLPIAFKATGNLGQILTATRAPHFPAAASAKGVENPLAGSALWTCRGGSPAIAAGYAFQVFGAQLYAFAFEILLDFLAADECR